MSSKIKAINDCAVYAEVIDDVSDDSDIEAYKGMIDTTIYFNPPKLSVIDSSTDYIETTDQLNEGDRILMLDNDNNIMEAVIDTVEVSDGTTNNLDIFNDGSCIAAYPLNGNANDLSGNYNGTWIGTEQYDTGVSKQAAKFDGNSVINIGKANEIIPAGTSFTISLWAKINDFISGRYNRIIGSVWFNGGFTITTDSGGASNFRYILGHGSDSSNNTIIYLNNTFTDKFYHIVIGYDSGAKKMFAYVDGVKVGEADKDTWSYADNRARFMIGGDATNQDNDTSYEYTIKGLVDQVRIFNRALTDDEIIQLYKEVNAYKGTLKTSLPATPKAAYRYSVPVLEFDIIDKELIVDSITEKCMLMGKIENNTINILDVFDDGSCVACYQLDGNANDLSGNHNGTWTGTEQYDTGRFGSAAKFDGNSYITLGHIINNVENDDYAVSLWIKAENYKASNDYAAILVFDDSSDNNLKNQISIRQSKYINELIFHNEGAHYKNWLFRQKVNNICNWNHVVFSVKAGYVSVYINGIKITSGVYKIQPDTEKGQPIRLGGTVDSDWYKFKGLIDQVRFFNRSLTDKEVKFLYCEGEIKFLSSSDTEIYIPDCVTPIIGERVAIGDGWKIDSISSVTETTYNSRKHYKIEFDNYSLSSADWIPKKIIGQGIYYFYNVTANETSATFYSKYDLLPNASSGWNIVIDDKVKHVNTITREVQSDGTYKYTVTYDTMSPVPTTFGYWVDHRIIKPSSITYDSTNDYFVAKYDGFESYGTAAHRRIILPSKDMIVYTPFVSNMCCQ